ncbi:MAG: site-specific integrase [Planctomycetota bacterium]
MNSRNLIPKGRLHKPSGRAVVTLNGRDIYLGAHGSELSRKEYDRVIREWLANGRVLPQDRNSAQRMSVAELIAEYWAYVQKHYVKYGKPTGEQDPIKAALRPVLDLYGHVDVSTFGPQALLTVRDAMIERGWVRYTINKHIGRVRRMFAWATERERIPGNIYHALLAVKGLQRGRTAAKEGKGVSTVPQEHVDAVLPHVASAVAAMIGVQLASGMRPGEVVLMRACDIDRSDTVWIYRPMRHKTEHHGHERTIPLGPIAQGILAPYLEDRKPEAFLFDPREAEDARHARQRLSRKSKLTPSQRKRKRKAKPNRAPREHYDSDSYRRAIARGCEKADVPNWTPHQLRHNTATLLQRKMGIEHARVVLGHHSPLVTEVYIERDTRLAMEAMARLG